MNNYVFNNSMTVVYNKNTGNIQGVVQGAQEINTLYGEDAADYALIADALHVPFDMAVMQSPGNYKVNPELKRLEIKKATSIIAYPVSNI